MSIGAIWDLIILSPLVNIVVVLSHYLFGSFGLTIIVLTIAIRLLTYPLTLKQLHATKAMQNIQSQVAELQKKYDKDRKRLAQEQMKLYREAGMNPAGCLLPMLIQMPVWIALYQAIVRVLAVNPEDFLNLSRHLYASWSMVFSQVPLESRFLWLDLAAPDRLMILPILVGASMWAQQKMTTTPSSDPRQQAQSQMMLWMMPLMFAFLTLQFPSGLALYWTVSNVIGIVNQYFVTGWGGLVIPGITTRRAPEAKKIRGQVVRQEASPQAGKETAAPVPPPEGEVADGKPGVQRQDRRRGTSERPGRTGRRPGGGGGRRRKGG
ncbi:MAG: membrane protein insertase YidC [Chloroflexi bacterium]|nr:membrane protein insertase YidC [Chloroflexota bacterium]